MRRFLLALLAAPLVSPASMFTFTSCTAGTTTLTPCPGNLALTTGLSGPNYFVSAFAEASDTPLGNILVMAESTAFYIPVPGLMEPPLLAEASASVDDIDGTAGPMRPGFIKISETIDSVHGNPLDSWTISGGPFMYGGGPFGGQGCLPGASSGKSCSGSATFPFELGIPFQVTAAVPVGSSVMPGQNGSGSEDQVTVTFSLFEADGITPVPFFAVPEPSTYGLFLCGFAALLICIPRVIRIGY